MEHIGKWDISIPLKRGPEVSGPIEGYFNQFRMGDSYNILEQE